MPIPIMIGWNEYEMRMDYTTDSPPSGSPSYQAFAPPGTATNDAQWTIYKYTYSGTNITRRQVAFKVAWDSRSTSF